MHHQFIKLPHTVISHQPRVQFNTTLNTHIVLTHGVRTRTSINPTAHIRPGNPVKTRRHRRSNPRCATDQSPRRQVRRSLFCRQAARPIHPLRSPRPRPIAFVLAVIHSPSLPGVAPIVPPLRQHRAGHVRPGENHPRISPPWPPQKSRFLPGDLALQECEPCFLGRRLPPLRRYRTVSFRQ